jgi:hypothetical protein
MVMMMAITPSLNAARRSLPTRLSPVADRVLCTAVPTRRQRRSDPDDLLGFRRKLAAPVFEATQIDEQARQ